MKRYRLHIMPHRRGWQVRRDGASRASVVRPTKAEAQAEGRRLAIRSDSELVFHDRGNVIRDSDSYGRDPRSRRDRVH